MTQLKYETFIKKILALYLLSGFLIPGCKKEVTKDPNFLVIITDDQSYRAIGYNNEQVSTPNLDLLAQKGVIFNRTYISTPVCAASRASLLTGLYPQTNGTVALDEESFKKIIVQEEKYKTLPKLLNESGYTTWFSGKSHIGPPHDYGFQYGEETFDYDDKRAFQDASDFIDRIAASEDQQPFLLWMAARQPHVPLHPSQEWLGLYENMEIYPDENFREAPPAESFYNQGLPGENFYRDTDYTDNYKNLPAGPPRSADTIKEFIKAYYATVSHLDYQIGELIKKMKSKGLMENTVVIFLSDNGYFLGNHGLGNKLTMHEESVRVPFFIYADKFKKKDLRTEAIISSIDIFPTILELAKTKIPDYSQGISLVPFLSGSTDKIRDYVVSESVGVGGSVGEGHRMVVTEDWKYMLSMDGDEALFNLKNDLYELKNLVNEEQYSEKLSELKNDLRKWKSMTGDKKIIPE